ncbi:BTB/POZ domain-containing protein At1g63850 [Ziziphus jujuba]|uniref:BTB/POZ domain-containing protein At1g63850 n=1 Tax=Ziziphus jujuba TaxID=326968 RepID=A0A6P4B388_ZIZJJ|nr:BTB/POZ domain-containing protein At1g63850 [Ziziphus jujuba]XP_060674616.1 BTB/POZ domain-containing protein At1g63850 [Ziziphus jujuba]XP_060674617.1 BTB/POZ domain-containing protein At1g63850 [Ziziphus jujuba]
MAATTTTTTTTTSHFKVQTQPTKPKRRKCRETTISTSAAAAATPNYRRVLENPTIVSPDNSWCCPASKHIPTPPPPPPSPPAQPKRNGGLSYHSQESDPVPTNPSSSSPASSPSSSFRIRFSPGSLSPVMDFIPTSASNGTATATATATTTANGTVVATNGYSGHHHDSFPSSFSKFNSVLTAGLLNPMSPPPPPDKTRSSPTLFEMMANEPDIHPRTQIQSNNVAVAASQKLQMVSAQDRQALMMQRIADALGSRSPGNQFNDPSSGDIKLTLSSRDGFSISMNVHRQILVAHSRFFAVKLSDRWTKQQRTTSPSPYSVEIADCDDVEIYIETLRLMYCKDLRKKLMKEDVPRVLGILKVSAAIGFDAGVLSCLEYLEAAPWAEDEEEKVASLLSELHLEGVGAGEVLKRVSIEVNNGTEEGNDNEEVLLKLLHVVLEGKDEKARRDMKGLVLKMLRENSSHNDLRKESLYSACDGCLQLLHHHFLRAAESDLQNVGQIARQADNMHWMLDILIDRQIAEDFLKTWASQTEMSAAHSKVPAVHRYEVSRVTARLFVGIGKGQLLASKDVRFLLLRTWLVPFYDDFAWMRRASRGLDRHLIEDGLSNTILTLPLAWQQEILLAWFNRFMNSSEDCPNIQRGFEVWWRRAFWRRGGEQERTRPLRITTATIENP